MNKVHDILEKHGLIREFGGYRDLAVIEELCKALVDARHAAEVARARLERNGVLDDARTEIEEYHLRQTGSLW